ncbi:MAG TPA: hypothetical protein VFB60_25795 [Ktedonobacteraceae bacterium]|nr:hypothetical protein [Ktedonobacteraceae bacterium]
MSTQTISMPKSCEAPQGKRETPTHLHRLPLPLSFTIVACRSDAIDRVQLIAVSPKDCANPPQGKREAPTPLRTAPCPYTSVRH